MTRREVYSYLADDEDENSRVYSIKLDAESMALVSDYLADKLENEDFRVAATPFTEVLKSRVYTKHSVRLRALGEKLHNEFVRELTRAKKEMGDECNLAEKNLNTCMTWSDSPQDHSYWEDWWSARELYKD